MLFPTVWACSRGPQSELEEIRKCGMKNFRNIQVDEANLLTWQGLIVPVMRNIPTWQHSDNLALGDFERCIFHPFLSGKVFLLLLAVIQSLIALVNDPQPEHPLRADLAEEYSKDRKKFCKNAEEFTKKYGEKRPVD
uniref:Ubiquitin conjugating enzyme E2 L5 n=1 Tax=Pavo cristatus TaxID=9049 RepID=A0A8C9G0X0_PAVCR